jgi:hypothetical protein
LEVRIRQGECIGGVGCCEMLDQVLPVERENIDVINVEKLSKQTPTRKTTTIGKKNLPYFSTRKS